MSIITIGNIEPGGIMRKTYITNMPDKAGAFLAASKAIAENDGNIVRVNYNKAVDTNALFLEVDANEAQHQRIANALKEIEYLTDDPGMRQIILIELRLPDRPGTLLPTLEVIKEHEVNIPYINSQENGTPYQNFKMGLLVEDTTEIRGLIDDLSKLCEVRVLNYEATDRLLDSTVFYVTFANELRETLDLTQAETNKALECTRDIMQTLDERKISPEQAFGHIKRFATFLVEHTHEQFSARITKRQLADNLTLYAIEPPCGSNSYVLEHNESLLFVNAGYAYFEQEMDCLLSELFDGFETCRKSIILTETDIESAGFLSPFDTIYLSEASYENFELERRGKPGLREQNLLQAPYCALTKLISRYQPPRLGRCAVIGKKETDDALETIGHLRFGEWTFEIIEGAGGHAQGELMVMCPQLKLIFTGALMENESDLTDDQRIYNELRPQLMSATDENPTLAKTCRDRLLATYAGYTICPGRGAIIE